ncbi:helix-turn-helix transcriptional regulator [Aeromonas veronii]|nr:AlpA family phage regulatory protein [Aeromonas veronii]
MNAMSQTAQLIDQNGLCHKLAISRPTLWRRRKDDPAFPKPIFIGPRAVRFCLADVEAYIEHLAAKGGRK